MLQLILSLVLLNGYGKASGSDLLELAPSRYRSSYCTELQETRHLLDAKLVPMSGATTKAFIPKGWKSQDEVIGDLNGDSLPDAVLQLIEDKPIRNEREEFQERQRALLILFKTADGKYARAAVASKLLMCASCGGMMGGDGSNPAADVKIEKGVLIVSQMFGARETTDLLQRFRYEAASKKFLLIGQDITGMDRLTLNNETVSTNYLTGKQVIERRKINQKTEKETVISKQTKVVAKQRKTIEEVDFEQ